MDIASGMLLLDWLLVFDFFVEVDFFSVLLSSSLSGEDIVVVSTTFSSLTAASHISINSNLNYS